ncbi:putative zinc cluster transcription factor [Scheffersomyces coipomensis]|uniref:putative zinc cluster transcription factor n=1 Tax=Scheffersomyces coipomensis TaxID=1788519 RepID=UPI00315DB710
MNILATSNLINNHNSPLSSSNSPPLYPPTTTSTSPTIKEESSKNLLITPNKKNNRVRTGCFCCRKRKKKCDEIRPTCHACMRNRIKCVYPHAPGDPLPHNFDLEKTTYGVIPIKRRKKRSSSTSHESGNELGGHEELFNVIITSSTSAKSNSEAIKSEEALQSVIRVSDHDSDAELESILDVTEPKISELSQELTPSSLISPRSQSSLISFSKYVANVKLSPQDSELYHHFLHEFMPSISLPHSHPLLSPDYAWVELSSHSDILTDVYLCCGASYMSYFHNYSNGSQDLSTYYSELSERKYSQAINSLSKAFADKSIDLDSDWLFAAGLALCLRDRAFGLNGSRCAKHLIFVYNLIKRRDYKKRLIAENTAVSLESSITPTERSLMDSFLFNYSAALLSCSKRDLITLPSPYEFFPQMKQWLDKPIFQDCDVVWMNNPVIGSALNSFEVISKLAWLLRMHFDYDEDQADGDDLSKFYLDDVNFWDLILPLREAIVEIERENNLNKRGLERLKLSKAKSYKALRSNLAVSIITLNASSILLEKLINPIIPSFLPLIQDRVNTILEELIDHIPADNHSSCLITLSLFITGISTVNDIQRQSLSVKLIESSNSTASNVGNNILEILKFGWEKETSDKVTLGDKGYKCFDLIFDRPTIESITF